MQPDGVLKALHKRKMTDQIQEYIQTIIVKYYSRHKNAIDKVDNDTDM